MRVDKITPEQWDMVADAIEQMGPIELKKLHIRSTKMAIKDMPELADQLNILLLEQQAELKQLMVA